ncbi:patatin-like phospholipase family protein [Burkholderia plantarii]|uniref:patatin-like phospholipase family protein n=1 Tax=Burkholderia plantarii TaxID=41899 RepID=UPI000705E467|nr:putative patatin-like phospholipase [Burkholderia plantarii]GLZ22356.1 OMP85 family outer membrane protein [Burkholderia plantarii]
MRLIASSASHRESSADRLAARAPLPAAGPESVSSRDGRHGPLAAQVVRLAFAALGWACCALPATARAEAVNGPAAQAALAAPGAPTNPTAWAAALAAMQAQRNANGENAAAPAMAAEAPAAAPSTTVSPSTTAPTDDSAPTHACVANGGPPGRPSIGLVLSGGGARGYAHLGVLKVLETHRIPVDCIAATSMGAVVGGLYASGMGADEMARRLSGVNLTDIAFDVVDRADLPQKRREDEEHYIGGLTVGFGPNGFKAPAGLIQGNRLQALLADWTAAVPVNQSFDKLPVPFRAVATDLGNGHMVVLDHGSLPLAIRASMALPGLFSPTEIAGRTLVDGGLVSNLPVSTARRMGADLVIAVDIGSQLRPLDSLASAADVIQQMLGILIRQNVAQQHAQLHRGDVLLEPDLGSLSFIDFQNAQQAIKAGEAAANAALPQLERYALSPADYAAYRAAHARAPAPPVRLAEIEIRAGGPVPKRVVADALHVKPGDIYDPQAINRDLLALSTSGNFDSVTQQVITDGNRNTLLIDAREKNWGPNFLLFGLGMSSSSSDEGGFRFHVGYRRPWLTESGLEFRADTTLGSDLQALRTELRQPLSSRYGFYLAPYAELERRFANVYYDDYKLTQYRLQTQRLGLDLGLPIARLGDFRVGLAYAHGSASATYNLPLDTTPDGRPIGEAFQPYNGHELTARARLLIDQLDDPMLPRRGYYLEMRVDRSIVASERTRYTELFGKAMIAQEFGRHSLSASIEGGKSLGGVSPVNLLAFTLGGFQHLSAYAADQLSGDALAYGQLTYMNRLMTFNASPIKAFYVGASAEVGNVWSADDSISSGPLKQSYSLFASFATSFGPIYVGVALAPGGVRNLYFQLGRTY